MAIRILQEEHGRDPAEVESLVRWVARRARVQDTSLAVKVMKPRYHDYPTGYATYWDVPRWAGRSKHSVSVSMISDGAPVLTAGPRVCWHSTQAKQEHRSGNESDEYQPVTVAAADAGRTHLGRWPIYETRTWQEALVHTLAHEFSHIRQFLGRGAQSEVLCEEFAAATLRRYREEFGS